MIINLFPLIWLGAGLLMHYIKSGKSNEEIIKTIYTFCVNLKIQTPRVCEGVSHLFGAEVIYVLKRVTIGPDEICSFVIGDACGDVYNPLHDWDVSFPPVQKPVSIRIQAHIRAEYLNWFLIQILIAGYTWYSVAKRRLSNIQSTPFIGYTLRSILYGRLECRLQWATVLSPNTWAATYTAKCGRQMGWLS